MNKYSLETIVENPLISVKEGVKQFNDYIIKLRNGYIPGIKTPYANLNAAMINGFPRNTISCIAAHSGVGKTTLLNNIITNAPLLNDDLVVLLFTLEMPVKSLISRVVSSNLKMSVKAMYLDVNEIEIDQKPLEALSELPIYYYEYGGTPDQIYHYVSEFCKPGAPGWEKNVLLCIDHSLLVDGPSDSEKVNGLAAKLNIIKKKYKSIDGDENGKNKSCVTTLILSQLNDAMLESRRADKKEFMFPMYQDIYQGRQIYHICDVVIALNNPAKYLTSTDDRAYNNLPVLIETDIEIDGKKQKVKKAIIYAHIIKGRECGTSIQSFIDVLEHNTLIPIIDKKEYKYKI